MNDIINISDTVAKLEAEKQDIIEEWTSKYREKSLELGKYHHQTQ